MVEPLSFTTYLGIGVITGAIGAYISEKKGRSHRFGFWVGFFFGIIGIIALSLMKKKED